MIASIEKYINERFSIKSPKEHLATACQIEFGVPIMNDKYIVVDGVNYQFKKSGHAFVLKSF